MTTATALLLVPGPPRTSTDTDAQATGLTTSEARRLLKELGANELTRDTRPSALRILAAQLKGTMFILLLLATLVAAAIGETADVIALSVVLVLNAAIGFSQELRAERALHALRGVTAPRARVVRDGRAVEVPASTVVPGDVLAVEAGDIVAADARVLEASHLKANEATLTGESSPVDKRPGADAADAPLAERPARLFAGTAIASGTARALVTETGMRTELGKIATVLGTSRREDTPLQRRIEGVARALAFLCIALVLVTAVIGYLRGVPAVELLRTSIALAIAAVPEGLAAIVTIALAVGVQRMVAKNVLVRRLSSVETLGCATVVCTDKTGTLTTGRMAVRDVWARSRRDALEVGAACSDAELAHDGTSGSGDPTEVALLVEAARDGLHRAAIEARAPRLATHPFDSDRKRMSIWRSDGKLYVKGAVDSIVALCSRDNGDAVKANDEMAGRGLRVLAVAIGTANEERDLALVGLIGFADPPRTEAIEAVAAARRAGIRTVMITGDHPVTANAIAREMGIVLPGEDAAQLVHARATPQQKIDVVRRWKERGEIVAMTGDGVNDAPALEAADIGIAMGRGGSEVTREAADMILVDDNFASIIAAVREGRGIYDNIRGALVYLLGGNIASLLIMLVALLAGWPAPLTAFQILWVNLVSEPLPALALVTARTRGDVLNRPPRRPTERMLGKREWGSIAASGLLTCLCVLGVFAWALIGRDEPTARSLAFSTLVIALVVRAFASRSTHETFLEIGLIESAWLVLVVVVTLALQVVLHQIPVTQVLFALQPLTFVDFAIAASAGLVPVTIIEVTKLVRRHIGRDRPKLRTA